jgi:hypothetical protein
MNGQDMSLMKIEPLSDELVEELMVDEPKCLVHKMPPMQNGPLRHFDREMRCANRGCSSPTHFKVRGISRCMKHALLELNYMLVSMGIER